MGLTTSPSALLASGKAKARCNTSVSHSFSPSQDGEFPTCSEQQQLGAASDHRSLAGSGTARWKTTSLRSHT